MCASLRTHLCVDVFASSLLHRPSRTSSAVGRVCVRHSQQEELDVQEYNTWRLIDFGSSAREGEECKPSFTWHFVAPEVIERMEKRNESNRMVASSATDVWAAGVMAYELMSGEFFFPEKASHDQIKSMLLGHTKLPHEIDPSVWAKIGRLKTTIKKMLSRDPTQRPSMSEISHKFNTITMSSRATPHETSEATTEHATENTEPGATPCDEHGSVPSVNLQSLVSDVTALVDSSGNRVLS